MTLFFREGDHLMLTLAVLKHVFYSIITAVQQFNMFMLTILYDVCYCLLKGTKGFFTVRQWEKVLSE